MPTTTIHERIAEDIHQAVTNLGLLNLQGGSLAGYLNTFPNETVINLPCWQTTFEGEEEQIGDATFEDNDTTYPVRILFMDRNPQPDNTNRALYLGWRKTVMDWFRQNVTLPNCPEVYDLRVRPQVIFDPRLPQYQFVVSGLEIQALAREIRPHP